MSPCAGFTGLNVDSYKVVHLAECKSVAQQGFEMGQNHPIDFIVTTDNDNSLMIINQISFSPNSSLTLDLINIESGVDYRLYDGILNSSQKVFSIEKFSNGFYLAVINLNENEIIKKLYILK